eukprot:TRINITY_DN18097_c0_g1_i3.p1 TRINITY_DN18097_c0_g1~~TRINITY_DN18097_c0_g1_i3.p1  ORF type:complete len:152 (+),score=10.07 TRINITY_DN18097_c0_g1_i3:73-528(+)
MKCPSTRQYAVAHSSAIVAVVGVLSLGHLPESAPACLAPVIAGYFYGLMARLAKTSVTLVWKYRWDALGSDWRSRSATGFLYILLAVLTCSIAALTKGHTVNAAILGAALGGFIYSIGLKPTLLYSESQRIKRDRMHDLSGWNQRPHSWIS